MKISSVSGDHPYVPLGETSNTDCNQCPSPISWGRDKRRPFGRLSFLFKLNSARYLLHFESKELMLGIATSMIS